MTPFDPAYEFLLFAGECYYPAGGWGDFKGSFASLENALIVGRAFAGVKPHDRWFHVVSIKTGIEVGSE